MDRRQFLSLAAAGFTVALVDPRDALHAADRSSAPPTPASSGQGSAYLTFDDGPGTGTVRTREILDRAGIPGTFFVVGQRAARQKPFLSSLVRGGHSVQNHSWSHPDLRYHPNPKRELERCSNVIEEATGKRPTHYRPPYAATNARIKRIGKSLGMKELFWNLSATPPLAHPNPPLRFRERIDEVRGKNDYIVVLFHDGSGDIDKMITLLPEAIAGFRERGFSFRKF